MITESEHELNIPKTEQTREENPFKQEEKQYASFDF